MWVNMGCAKTAGASFHSNAAKIGTVWDVVKRVVSDTLSASTPPRTLQVGFSSSRPLPDSQTDPQAALRLQQ